MRPLLPLLICVLACEPPVEVPALPAPQPPSARVDVRLAGDAVATGLIQRLAEEFTARNPGEALVVEAPLGGRGAQRALQDGVLDAALVVVGPGETPPPGSASLATTRVVLAAGRATGLRERWSPLAFRAALTGGEAGALRFILRGPDDPLQRALGVHYPGLGPAFERAFVEQRWLTLTEDAAVRDALRATPGAVVVADSGSLALHGLPVWSVSLGEPTPILDVRVVPRADAPPRLGAFLAWATGPDGQAAIQEFGYGGKAP
ncbi:MAG: hypothetical protein H6706_19970 [Myxococcales bacterium]|nr:hypothetical protein [Myxococcales bacterium]